MCLVMEVSRSGYYAFRKRPKSEKRIRNEKLLIEIKRIYWEHKKRYGSPRIWNQLSREGISCSENRVARLMNRAELVGIQRDRFRATTDSGHDYPVWPNILQRDFSVERPDTVWVSDITYVWTWEGWLYVSVLLDLYSRGIVGLAMDKTIAESLPLQALQQAITRRNPAKGLICHSDRGSQYAGNGFKDLLASHGFIGSMSRKGDCWDNAVAESFFHTLKVELVRRTAFKTREEAKNQIFEYVEMYYNRKRAHSTIGYLSPFDYERRALQSLQLVH